MITTVHGGPEAALERLRDGRVTPVDYQDGADWFGVVMATCRDRGDRPELHEIADGAGGPPVLLPLRRRARPIGPFPAAGLAGLTTCYTSRFAPLGVEDTPDPAAALTAWATELRDRPDRPHWLTLEALDDAPARALATALATAGYLVEVSAGFGNWFLPAEGLDYPTWWSARPSRLRATVERKERALGRAGAGIAVEVLDTPATAQRAITAYRAVEAASWKPPEPHPLFLPALIRAGLDAGCLEVGVLTVAGEPVAAQLWLIAAGRATIFKLVHAEAFRTHSPGSILTRRLIRRALERGDLREIDLGRGDDPYKRDWLPERRQRWRVDAYEPRTVLGLLLAARNLAPRALRRRGFSPSATRGLAP